MFAATVSNDALYLFYADDLAGPWVEHLSSPVVEGDANIARSGGRVLQFDDRLLRITQDDTPTYANQVRAFEITTLSKVDAEFEVPESPLLSATGSGWNSDGMHHIDAVGLPISDDGVNWGLPVTAGTFVNDASIKEIRFAPVTGQFVRLRALSEVNGNPWTSMAESDKDTCYRFRENRSNSAI